MLKITSIVFLAVLCVLAPNFTQAAGAQTNVCAAPAGLAPLSGLGSCTKINCSGTLAVEDLVRTGDLASSKQWWAKASTLTPASPAVNCATGAWSTIGALGIVLPNPTTPTPVIMQTVTVSWDPSTTNDDKSPLTDLAQYTVYMGTAGNSTVDAGPMLSIGNVKVPLTSFTTIPIAPGQYVFSVTASNASGVESIKATPLLVTLAKPLKVPSSPSNIRATVNPPPTN